MRWTWLGRGAAGVGSASLHTIVVKRRNDMDEFIVHATVRGKHEVTRAR